MVRARIGNSISNKESSSQTTLENNVSTNVNPGKLSHDRPNKKLKDRKDSRMVAPESNSIELNKPLSYIFTMTKDNENIAVSYKTRTPMEPSMGGDYCAYHKVNGHETDNCNVLAKIVQKLTKNLDF